MAGITAIAHGLRFPEGPIAISDSSIILVEIERQTLSRVHANGDISVVAALGGGPNGASNSNAFVVSVEAVVQDGKIRTLAYLPANQPLRADPALDGRAQLPASVGLGAVVAVLLGVLMIASVGLTRRGTSPSSLRGRLMHDLQGWSAARQ